MNRVEFKFCFQNVGHGLFYTGRIGKFNFVYDCGSISKQEYRNRAIREYKDEIKGKDLDLLIISHFDKDHISGIDELLDGIHVKDVVIPYLTPEERLLMALKRTGLEDWHYDFLSDPVRYLIEEGDVERVVVVKGENTESNAEEEAPPFEEGNEEIDFSRMDDYSEHKKIREEEGWNEEITKKLSIKNHNKNATVNLWLFRFFNSSHSVVNMNDFIKCVEGVLDGQITKDDVGRAIKDEGKRRDLRRCYEKLGAINDTSLMVYHGPNISQNGAKICSEISNDSQSCFLCHKHKQKYPYVEEPKRHGHLLTGDIRLEPKWDEIANHYSGHLPNVLFCLVPHHGSVENWDDRILKKINRQAAYVVSASVLRRYGLPNDDVIDAISKNNLLFGSNEFNKPVIKGVVTI